MKSMKTLALVIGLLGLSGVSQAQFSSTWTAVSDYDFRGFSQSAKDPALQASADYAFADSGFLDRRLGVERGLRAARWRHRARRVR